MSIAKFKVDKAFNIDIEEQYRNPEYELFVEKESTIAQNGLLQVFTLKSKDQSLPRFVGRWDQNKEVIDIDMYDRGRTKPSLDFKKGTPGYSGHHPKRISKDIRTFQVSVEIPNVVIYTGLITFNINWGVDLFEQVSLQATLSHFTQRRTWWKRLFGF